MRTSVASRHLLWGALIGSSLLGCGTSPESDVSVASVSTPVLELAALSTGTVTTVKSSVVCPADAASGANCLEVRVRCPGIPDLNAVVAVATPSGNVKGTLFAHRGAGGNQMYNSNINDYVMNGLRTVQVAWVADWERTPDKGVKDAACRPATLIKWAFDSVHGQDRSKGFCGVGHSGGSGVLAYALAHYGMDAYLDYAALSAGPPFGRIDYACAPQTYSGPARTLCPELQNAPIALGLSAEPMNEWENTSTCGSASPLPSEIDKWREDSVVSSGASYNYSNTRVTFWNCAYHSNATAGGAYFYSQEILSSKQVTCFTEAQGCSGEGLGAYGSAQLKANILAGCVPRH